MIECSTYAPRACWINLSIKLSETQLHDFLLVYFCSFGLYIYIYRGFVSSEKSILQRKFDVFLFILINLPFFLLNGLMRREKNTPISTVG